MKKLTVLSLAASLCFLTACDKDDDSTPSDPILQDYNEVYSNNFNTEADLEDWTFDKGDYSLDASNKYEGSHSLHLKATGGCFSIYKVNQLEMDPNKAYLIRYRYQINDTEDGQCLYNFIIGGEQDKSHVFSYDDNVTDGWLERSYIFQPNDTTPLDIDIQVGTDQGVWFDQLEIYVEK